MSGGETTTIVLKYLLEFLGFALLTAAAALVVMDLVNYYRGPRHEIRTVHLAWRLPNRLAVLSLIPLLAGLSIAVVPAGMAGVRVSQISGTLPETLYPGLHLVVPLVQTVETYDVRDQMFETTMLAGSKTGDSLRVQTKEGLELGLAVTVRFRLDPHRLAYIHANLPQPVEKELVPPVVASAFRDLTPRYLVRELFATKRDEIQRTAAPALTPKLAADAYIVQEVDQVEVLEAAEGSTQEEAAEIVEEVDDLHVSLCGVEEGDNDGGGLKCRLRPR